MSELSQRYKEEREKIVKILNAPTTIIMHICMVTVTIMHLCTILHSMMWVFFCSKCVKSGAFSILHNFAHADGISLS